MSSLLIIPLFIILWLIYDNSSDNEKSKLKEKLTKEEENAIVNVIAKYEKKTKRKISHKELNFVVSSVKNWRIHKIETSSADCLIRKRTISPSINLSILESELISEWKKLYPEDYAKYHQQPENTDINQ